jgi:hypothetical protein
MELRQPAQYYSTTLFDRYQPQRLSFTFIPARSLADGIPPLSIVAIRLDAELLNPRQIHPWHLPILLASLLPGYGTSQVASELLTQLTRHNPIMMHPNQLGFAEYIAYSDVIPFEESPLKGKSLMAIAGTAGVQIGLMAAGGDPIVLLTVPLGILLCTAAAMLGPGLAEKLIGS